MSLFKKPVVKVEEQKDFVGGYSPLPTDIYRVAIKRFYLKPTANGGQRAYVDMTIFPREGNPVEHRENYFIANANGETTYTKDGKTYHYPDFQKANDIAVIITGKDIFELADEGKFVEKTLNIYNGATRSEQPESVLALVEVFDKELYAAVQHIIKNKEVNDGTGKYVPTNEQVEINEIHTFLKQEGDTAYTVNELKAGINPPEFVYKFLEKQKGKPRNTFKEVKSGSVAGTTKKASTVVIG